MSDRTQARTCPECRTSNPAGGVYCSACGTKLGEPETLSYAGEPGAPGRPNDGLNLPPGSLFAGRYLIIEELGHGGMGRVFKATDQKLGLTVALKMIRPEQAANATAIDLFKKETLLARSLVHENIIRIFDLGESQGLTFISMEYVSGQNLGQLLRASGALTEETAVSIARQVCLALEAAHSQGIIHRDLKPSNILLDPNGRVRVADFGLARTVESAGQGPSGQIVGTPPYMSPEQAQGRSLDARTDIYALGIILYEMLAGRRPFESRTTTGYLEKHIHEKPKPPSSWNRRLAPDLERTILGCLEKDPAKRFQGAREVLTALDRPRALVTAQTARRRTQTLVAAFSGALIVLGIFLGLIFFPKHKTTTQPLLPGGRISVAVVWFENDTGNRNYDPFRKSLACEIIQSLLPSRFIRVITGDRMYEILEDLDLLKAETLATSDLKRVAAQAQADYVLHGNLSKFGNRISLNTQLLRTEDWEVAGSQHVEDQSEHNLFQMIDRLIPLVKNELLTEQQITVDYDQPIAAITHSTEALEHYLAGKMLYNERKFEESNAEFRRAVSLDSELVDALWSMAINYSYLDNPSEEKSCLDKALALAAKGRLAFRDECLIRGFYAQTYEHSIPRAIDYYQKLLSVYPDDEEGNIVLGALYRNLEEWDLAERHFLRVQTLNRHDNSAYASLSQIFMAKGQYDRAREFLQRFEESIEPAYYRWMLSQIDLCQGRYPQALEEIDRALKRRAGTLDFLLSQGHAFLLAGDIAAAQRSYELAALHSDPSAQLRASRWMSQVALLTGRFRDSRSLLEGCLAAARKNASKSDELETLLRLAYQEMEKGSPEAAVRQAKAALSLAEAPPQDEYSEKQALHVLGLSYLKGAREEDALRTADRLKELVEQTGYPKHMRYYYHLLASCHAHQGDLPLAVREAQQAIDLLPGQNAPDDEHGLFLNSLATFLESSGDPVRALSFRQTIRSLTTGRLVWEALYSDNFFRLGTLFQKTRQPDKARNALEQFLLLRKDADAGRPEISEAQRELTRLKGP